MQSDSDTVVPVFVFPTSVKFTVEDTSTHKQLVTLYNPYNYSVRFKVLATDAEKYTVTPPEGIILTHHRADIVIRLNDARASNCDDAVDRFRFQIMNRNSRTALGKQDIISVFERSRSATPESDFQTTSGIQSAPGQQLTRPESQSTDDLANSPSYVVLTVALVCVGGLLFPTEKEGEPASLYRVPVSLKLVFAYVLGLVTWVILKTR